MESGRADDLDFQFTSRLSSVEECLMEPLLDQAALACFGDKWCALVEDLAIAIEAKSVSISTISLADALAEKVTNVLQDVMRLEEATENMVDTFQGSSDSQPPSHSPSPPKLQKRFQAAYIAPSYAWLLKNLHKPYPSVEVRNALASESCSPRKDIDNWFIDVRKRIGWSELRRKRFSNKLAEIIKAGSIFFGQNDCDTLDAEVECEFAALELRANELYPGILCNEELAPERTILGDDEANRGTNNSLAERAINIAPSSPGTLNDIEREDKSRTSVSRKRNSSQLEELNPISLIIDRPTKKRRAMPSVSNIGGAYHTTTPSAPSISSSSEHNQSYPEILADHQSAPAKENRETYPSQADPSTPCIPFNSPLENWFGENLGTSEQITTYTDGWPVVVDFGAVEYRQDSVVTVGPDGADFWQTLGDSRPTTQPEGSGSTLENFHLDWESADSLVPLPTYSTLGLAGSSGVLQSEVPDFSCHLPQYTDLPAFTSWNPPEYINPEPLVNLILNKPEEWSTLPRIQDSTAIAGIQGHLDSNASLPLNAAYSDRLPLNKKRKLLSQMKEATRRLEEELGMMAHVS